MGCAFAVHRTAVLGESDAIAARGGRAEDALAVLVAGKYGSDARAERNERSEFAGLPRGRRPARATLRVAGFPI